MLKLTSILKAVGQLYKALTDKSTLTYQYIILPNGLKFCWGGFSSVKYGDSIPLPITFNDGIGILIPNYNTGTTMNCNFSTDFIRNRSHILVVAYDVTKQAASTSTTLSGAYFVIGS